MRSWWRIGVVTLAVVVFFAMGACTRPKPVVLRLGVSLTAQELASFEAAVMMLDEKHPNWTIQVENTPQQAFVEKLNAQLASKPLPDVVRVQGLFAQQWIRQGAFLDLGDFIEASCPDLEERIEDVCLDLEDFYPGPLDQFRWQGTLWGLPDTAAPTVLFYNKEMFDAAGLAYPDDDWTYEDMRQAARLLTLDREGRNATDPQFDPAAIVQWGWNGSLTYIWQRAAEPVLSGRAAVRAHSEVGGDRVAA